MDKFAIMKEYTKNCYSPYSNINVVCMIPTENDYFFGVNIENSSYGVTLCAEKSALASLISNGIDTKNLNTMYILTNTLDYITPCGSCLQFISEFVSQEFKIITLGNNNKINEYKLKDLFPSQFRL